MTPVEMLAEVQTTVSELIAFLLPTLTWLTAVVLVISVVLGAIYGVVRRVR